jgi:hypothetical protein
MAEHGGVTIPFSAVALAVAIVSYFTGRLAGYSKDVVEERSKWREKIRDCARASVFIRTPKVGELKSEFLSPSEIEAELITRLNPLDNEDIDIIKCFKTLLNAKDEDIEREFLTRVALLLKHDWERAKWEARVFKNPLGPPQRMKFKHYKDRAAHLGGLL